MEKKWYALYSRPNSERKLVAALLKRQITHYCPGISISKSQSKSKWTSLFPFFAGYVFVYITEAEQSTVMNVPEVVHFVYWLDSPAEVQNEEIDAMRFVADGNSRLYLEGIVVTPVPRRCVAEGPFLICVLTFKNSDHRTLSSYLPSLGITITARMGRPVEGRFRFFKQVKPKNFPPNNSVIRHTVRS